MSKKDEDTETALPDEEEIAAFYSAHLDRYVQPHRIRLAWFRG